MMNPIYWHPVFYELGIRFLYRSNFKTRYTAVAELIPEHSCVIDVCAGDCALYRYALKTKNVEYQACDLNKTFLRWAHKKGIKSYVMDLNQEDDLPKADVVVMMGSLCQFHDNVPAIVDKMKSAARQRVIITEAVHNMAQSSNTLVRGLAFWFTRVGSQTFKHRFDPQTFEQTLKPLGFNEFQSIAGGRDMLTWRDCS